jgi:hypothetical protein
VSTPEPGATLTITIDDLPIGANLNGLPRKLNPGHHVVVARAGGAQATAAVDLAAGDSKTVELVLSRGAPVTAAPIESPPPAETTTSSGLPALAYLGMGLGAAGLAAGSITGLLSISKKGDLEKSCPGGDCPRSVEGDLDSARTLATVSNVSFVVAGVGAVVAVVAILTAKPGSAPPATTTARTTTTARSLVPYAGLGGAGFRGAF